MEPTAHPLLFGVFKRTSPPVFAGSALVLFGLVAFVLRDPAAAADTFATLQAATTAAFGWVYRYAITAVLLFSLLMLVSRHGRVRLGTPYSEPAFEQLSWFAMMFGAGMGIGLLFWSVSEPLAHFARPPSGPGGTAAAGVPTQSGHRSGAQPTGGAGTIGADDAAIALCRTCPHIGVQMHGLHWMHP